MAQGGGENSNSSGGGDAKPELQVAPSTPPPRARPSPVGPAARPSEPSEAAPAGPQPPRPRSWSSSRLVLPCRCKRKRERRVRSHPPGTECALWGLVTSNSITTTARSPAATQSSTDLASRRRTCQRRRSHRTCSRPTSSTWVLLRLEALAWPWPRFQSIECGLLASPLTLPTAPATYNMSSGGSQTLPHAHCMPPYRWRSKCCGRTPMTEDMSTRPRPRLRAARLTLGRWCALQAVRRMAVAPEPTGASAEGSSPAPLLCDVLSYFG